MEVFVKFEVFDTIHEQEDMLALRQVVGRRVQQIQESDKVREFRAFSDARGGFMLVDIDSARSSASCSASRSLITST